MYRPNEQQYSDLQM